MTLKLNHPLIVTLLMLSAGFAVLIVPMLYVHADTMTFVSDLITNSIPGELSNHTITFTPTSAVPVSGKIVVVFQTNGISIPATLSHTDLDLEVNSVQRDLASVPGIGAGSPVGVVVTAGVTGQLVFTLNDTNDIPAGSVIRVTMGNNASHQTAGVNQVTNGSTIGSYVVNISTRTAANGYIDVAGAVFVLVQGVGLSVETPTPPPGGGGGGSATPTPLVMSIQLWPAEFATITPQEFVGTTFLDMAALAGMTPQEWYAQVLSVYPPLPSEVGDVSAVMSLTMGAIAQQLGITTTELYNALNADELRYLYTQPSPLGEISFAEFSESGDAEVASLLGLTVNEFYAWLDANYASVGPITMGELATILGVSPSQLQATLAAAEPGAASLLSFGTYSADQVAAALNINLGELFGVLNLTMADVASLADVSPSSLYDDLGLEGYQYESEPPAIFPETSITTSVTPGDGPIPLGMSGEPATFITDTMESIGLESIQDGSWLFTTYAQATDTGGHTSLTGQIWVLSENGEMTMLFEQLITNDLTTALTEYVVLSSQPSFAVEPGDRLVLMYVTQTTGGTGDAVTVAVTIGGTEHYSFVQSPPTQLNVPVTCFRIADFNDDCRVNITDFSILMANWGPSPRNVRTDINLDNLAGIIDLSILLYWWTG